MPSRRSFIKSTVGLVIGTTALPSFSAATEQVESRKLGVCLVGLGDYSTTRLAPALAKADFCRLTAVVTGSPYKIPLWRQNLGLGNGSVYSYEAFDQIANNSAIDVVYIALPTSLHVEYAVRAANAGKHVWCEKPMALTALECKAIIDACERNRVSLSIGYRLHHEPNLLRFKRWAKELPYGPIRTITCSVGWAMAPTPHTWRMSKLLGGGMLYDLGVYVVNGLRLAAQEEPIAVTASHVNTRPALFGDTSEETSFTLEFASGIVGHGCYTSRREVNLLEVQCRDGWYKLDNLYMMYDGLNGGTSDGQVFKDETPNQQRDQMDEDSRAICKGEAPRVPGIEGLRDIHILETINLSARLGQRLFL